ncbi:MAG TPA: DUF2304 domain-containing protein [Candidatus Saccharibacteria bacterium]|jgi:hypothetical protein|nr:DUF2304 domain-containing protein [Candidatus Saccharibacteria bacterium]HMR38151.1 DUF2304 domain-containing protein [Candidatus Saccharibacteria bacterium]
MTSIIQIIIIIFAIIIALVTLGSRSTHSGKAWKKVALVLLAVGMIIVVLFPDITNQLAHLVGVGRGADLLLYATIVSFILYALNNYLYQQDQRNTLHRLARKLALMEASQTNDSRKNSR